MAQRPPEDTTPESVALVDEDGNALLFKPTQSVIDERSDFDPHRPVKADDLGEDWGDGFFVEAEPVLVERDARGEIVRTTPLSEIPGVQMHGVATARTDTEDTSKPVSLSRDERRKLVDSLALRLFNYYKRQPKGQGFNPFHDGIPEIADADPLNLSPGKSEAVVMKQLATDTEIFLWLRKFVGARAEVIDKNRGNGVNDLALRLSRNPD